LIVIRSSRPCVEFAYVVRRPGPPDVVVEDVLDELVVHEVDVDVDEELEDDEEEEREDEELDEGAESAT
jgi:hypothetical protein